MPGVQDEETLCERGTRLVILTDMRVLRLYIVFLAFYSAAIPLGSYYLKFDWLGAVILILYGGWLFQRGRIALLPTKYMMMFLVFLVLNGVTVDLFYSSGFNLNSYITYCFQYVLALLVFVTIASMRLSTQQATKAMFLWVALACAAGVVAVAQKLTGDLLVDRFLFIPYYEGNLISEKVVSGFFAPTAWFSEASWMGSFMVVPTSYMIFGLSQKNYWRGSPILHMAVLSPMITGVVLGYSLTTMLSIVIAMGAMLVVTHSSKKHVFGLIFVASCMLVTFSDTGLIALQITRFAELWSNISDFDAGSMSHGTATSFYVRSIGFAAGIGAFLDHPIIGNGAGQAPFPYHSGFITLLADLGLVGALLIYSLPLIAVLKLLKISKACKGNERFLALSLIVCLSADYANGMITHHSFHLQRWLLISIAFSWILGVSRARQSARGGGSRQQASNGLATQLAGNR